MSAIAIDGPAGAGKSTIAKLLAKQLGYVYVDTGAMYRAMAVYFSQNDINPDDENAINGAVDNIDISIEYKDGVQQVILNGENVTSLLRTEETGKMASKTSKYAAVRTKLVALQRGLAKKTDESCSFDAIKEDIEKRDYEDMHRAISPLKQADDAVLVDTSDMNIEQVVAALSKIIDEKKAGR